MDHFSVLPNFMVIGAAKAGSTTLFDLLKQHPEIYLPFNKEPFFFCSDANFKRGVEWYAHTFFRQAAGYKARGEATPQYLYWSAKVAPRIHEVYGQVPVKFIAIFRDPVARAYSFYWNMIMEVSEDLSFADALGKEATRLAEHHHQLECSGDMLYGYKRGSSYASALQPFLEIFPRKNFHFLLLEDLGIDFSATTRDLFDFLELDANVTITPTSSNLSGLPRSARLQKYLNTQSPLRTFIANNLSMHKRYQIMTLLRSVNLRQSKYPKIDPDVEAALREHFAPEVRRLEEIIQRDLSAWLPK